jgi:hypothetical protein
MHVRAEWAEQLRNVAIALSREGCVIARHEEIDVADAACGAQLANQKRKCCCGRSLQLNEIRSECAQAGAKFNKALAQEPGAVSTRAVASYKAGLPDEEWQERGATLFRGGDCGNEGGVVSEPKISTEPKEYGWL